MEKIITLKVNLEHPNEAHHAINKAVEAYEESKKRCALPQVRKSRSSSQIRLVSAGDGIS